MLGGQAQQQTQKGGNKRPAAAAFPEDRDCARSWVYRLEDGDNVTYVGRLTTPTHTWHTKVHKAVASVLQELEQYSAAQAARGGAGQYNQGGNNDDVLALGGASNCQRLPVLASSHHTATNGSTCQPPSHDRGGSAGQPQQPPTAAQHQGLGGVPARYDARQPEGSYWQSPRADAHSSAKAEVPTYTITLAPPAAGGSSSDTAEEKQQRFAGMPGQLYVSGSLYSCAIALQAGPRPQVAPSPPPPGKEAPSSAHPPLPPPPLPLPVATAPFLQAARNPGSTPAPAPAAAAAVNNAPAVVPNAAGPAPGTNHALPPLQLEGRLVQVLHSYTPQVEEKRQLRLLRLRGYGACGAVYEAELLADGSADAKVDASQQITAAELAADAIRTASADGKLDASQQNTAAPTAPTAAAGGHSGNMRVAVKMFERASKSQAVHEVRVLQMLVGNPRFLQLYALGGVPLQPSAAPDAAPAQGAPGANMMPCVIMELCDASLEGPQAHTEEQVRGYMRSVLRSVNELHQGVAGSEGTIIIIIRHRDIKAGNVLRTREGTLKLCDFGSAHPYSIPSDKAPAAAAAAAAGEDSSGGPCKRCRGPVLAAVAGTALYMAPQIGSKTADNTYGDDADAYSCIVLTISLLLGGNSVLSSLAKELPAGSGVQRHSLSSWLWDFSFGNKPQQLRVSKELRSFVRSGITGSTPEELLSHPWLLEPQS